MAAAKKTALVVTAPLIGVRDLSGRTHQFYQGSVVDGFPKDEVDRLIELGFLGEATNEVVPVTVASE